MSEQQIDTQTAEAMPDDAKVEALYVDHGGEA
jgi:hypothetical protein